MRFMVAGATTTVESLLADAEVGPYLGAMVTPNTRNRLERVCSWGVPWCIDNACFDAARFSEGRYLSLLGGAAGASRPPVFVTVPDVVGDHQATLRRFWQWLPRLAGFGLALAFVAQDGLDYWMDDLPWCLVSAVFVGGTDEFKDDMTMTIADRCRERGKWCHVGRVNGRTRLRLALHNGCDSVDGSSLSMFPKTWIPKFARDAADLAEEGRALDRLISSMKDGTWSPMVRPDPQLTFWGEDPS